MLALGPGVSHSSEAHTSFDLEKQLRLAPGKWWVENPLSYFDFQRPACWKRRKQLPAGAGRAAGATARQLTTASVGHFIVENVQRDCSPFRVRKKIPVREDNI